MLEEFSKVTAAKEKDRTSVKFQDKTTNTWPYLSADLLNFRDKSTNSLQNYQQPS